MFDTLAFPIEILIGAASMSENGGLSLIMKDKRGGDRLQVIFAENVLLNLRTRIDFNCVWQGFYCS